MMKRKLLALLALLCCLCACAGAESIWTATDLSPAAEEMPLAEDITQEVLINGEVYKEYDRKRNYERRVRDLVNVCEKILKDWKD